MENYTTQQYAGFDSSAIWLRFTFMPLGSGLGWFKAFCIEKIIKTHCYFIRRMQISVKHICRTENGEEGTGDSKCRMTLIVL